MIYIFQNISQVKLDEGKQLVRNKGGKFYTDGSFEVSGVEGRLSYDGSTLTVLITDKPWLASWEMIESELRKFFK